MNFRERYRYDPSTDKLGSGGFATVFRAEDTLLEREVALKIFHVSESTKVNLLSELKRMSKLDHPNLIRCLDILNVDVTNVHGLAERLSIGVMEYANGGSLKEFSDRNNDLELSKAILIQVLKGLSYLHSKAIIHRDLKPQNILLSNYEGELIPKISDFGISKSISADDRSSSVVMGTIEYMAPEQFNPNRYGINGRISTNLDLWSFGILTYELITKRHLFGDGDRNSSSEQVMNAILSFSLPEDIDKVPEPFHSVIKSCLVADANVRVKDAKELIALLQKGEADFIKPAKTSYEGETKLIRKVENIEIKPLVEPEEKKPVEVKPPVQPFLKQEQPAKPAPAFTSPGKTVTTDSADSKNARKKMQLILGSAVLVVLVVAGIFIFKPAAKNGNAGKESSTAADSTAADKAAASLTKMEALKKENPVDTVKLFNLSMDCALAGNADCQYQYGILLNAYQRPIDGFDMLGKASAQDHVKATSELAYMYYDGVPGVVQKDIAKARSLYVKAAAADNSVAILMLGIMYKQGVGVEKDVLKANTYFRRVVQLDDNPDAVSRANQEVTGN